MRIAIFGAGGVGGYFGGRLAQAGHDVLFIARGEHLRAIRESGLQVDSISGDFVIRPAVATDRPAEAGLVDVILLGVKAWQVAEAAEAMRPMIGPDTIVVPLQNGVEAPAQLAAFLGEDHAVAGLCGISAFVAGPGHIRHVAMDEPFVQIGELDNRSSSRITRLRNLLMDADSVTADVPADIHAALWGKFLFIVGWGGVGAITRSPVGVFRQLPATRSLLRQAMQEVYEVALAHQIALPDGIVAQTMKRLDQVSPEGTASMQRDIMNGRPSELEAQTGALVRLGTEVGVATPVNSFIYDALLPSEMKARGELQFPV
jgi:2-dehydropantoate 2-reductase